MHVFFDNVGGPLLNSMLPLMTHRGRVVCCGAAAQYDERDEGLIQPGPQGIPQHLINQSLRLEEFMTADFAADWNHALGQLGKWLSEEAINAAVHMWHGLESAPDALLAVLAGENSGQAVVRISPEL